MNKEIVRHAVLLAGTDGNTYLQCTMVSGSVWNCDMNGNNWERVMNTTSNLTIKFHKEVPDVDNPPLTK